MRYMMIYRNAKDATNSARDAEHCPPDTAEMEKVGKLIGEMFDAGVLISTEGLLPSSKGARVRSTNGEITVTDGPFAEAKEVIAGYAIVKVKSMDEAIGWARRFLAVVGDGESEVRQLYDYPESI